jgi:hypothetical protein
VAEIDTLSSTYRAFDRAKMTTAVSAYNFLISFKEPKKPTELAPLAYICLPGGTAYGSLSADFGY